MATLPEDPDLDQLRRQAKELQRAARAGEPRALIASAEHAPDRDPTRLSTAQQVLARVYGFASWPRLVRHLAVVSRHRRAPDEVPPSADPVTEFLRLACLTYGDDSRDRPRAAAAMLAADPALGRDDVYAAAATADGPALRRLLGADPGLARRDGGPFGWVPLLYLAYARHDPGLDGDRVLSAADALLAAGADPDAGFLWHGLPMPFTALTGAFGGGEGDQAPHPQGAALARRLLEAGADANDGQTLYNRMFTPDDAHLRLLLAFGLGQGDGGPWRRRLGSALGDPATLLRRQLRWAVDHAMVDRVRLLAEHGVDVVAPFTEAGYGERSVTGVTPAELAARHGYADLLEALVDLGAGTVELDPVQRVVAAVLRGEHVTVPDDVVAAARAARPALVVQAAASGRTEAVTRAAELGFDLDARGRADTPSDQPWETGLHAAVAHGHGDVVRLLLGLGADPTVRDARFDGTLRGWAEHLQRPDLADLLPPDPTREGPAQEGPAQEGESPRSD